ncbi:site-specific tyrosine recombinase/integron integrase [Lactobacillus kefiranofaciens]|uniref:Tyrosine recombinase XerC n=1 Tax=Lactobacillus kefiranofaciens TaxID=267818 RepID=A0AAX3UF79_9LACO|nr:site-specific tyrosine recombinase/integron integrase [Lactobacillus kefiranofaciens]AEG40380.1 Tyrosine recombinase xerC [Lactobacillus kefiranofaciens subsp. kefiranofaciens]KRL24502.1 tyrosine recombinase xerC [Lactobacillus kefiranofaciens subsp. kefirgranum DSM 10550 = JCM 8572]KRM21404.1 tyrosine recombinase xerC [Lactobacillus kefiranofaciens subsp. kefiranofaciens DSM 5016 = JCM 6985]MCJ2172092.1 tyrosine-type recombinase/integrase [Lactobacillus kefiranofaciens]MCP9329949.1 tyrosin
MTDQKDELALFISYLTNERRYSKDTISAYQTDLLEAKSFWTDNGGFDGWDKVQDRDIEVYLQHLAERKLARNSQMRQMSSFHSFYRFLTKRKLVKVDPTQGINLRRGEKKLPEFFYETEMRQVFDSLCGDAPLKMRNLALFELFYATGMRVSEVSTLCLKQIDWDMKTILVHGKGKKDRYVMFDGHTQKALLNYLEKARPKLLKDNSEQHVFLSHLGRPLSTRGIQYVMQKTFNQAGISGKVHPHELRHTFATAMISNGADLRSVQELLGHKSLAATQIYTHVTMKHLKQDYEKYFPRNKES